VKALVTSFNTATVPGGETEQLGRALLKAQLEISGEFWAGGSKDSRLEGLPRQQARSAH
jgi:hypothetical protein